MESNSNLLTLVGQIIPAQTATPVYNSPDFDTTYFVIQKGGTLGEVAEIVETGTVFKTYWLKTYTNQPNKFWYIPFKPQYFPEWHTEIQEGSNITTPLLLTGLAFTTYQSFTANNRKNKNLWGLGAAGFTGLLIYNWVKGIDLNPFN